MASSEVSAVGSILISGGNFVQYYRESKFGYAAVTISSVIFGLSALPSQSQHENLIRIIAGGLVFISIAYYYISGRPFGMRISCTPTHVVNDSREPDKESESRGIAMIQEDSSIIHSQINISKFSKGFKLRFNSSSDIQVELRSKPRTEHTYSPDNNILSCENVSDHSFPAVIDIRPQSTVATGGRYHTFEIIDEKSGRRLKSFDIIHIN